MIVFPTGRPRVLRPRFPCSASQAQCPYWTGSGRSSKYLCRIAASSRGVGSPPASTFAVSPGIARDSREHQHACDEDDDDRRPRLPEQERAHHPSILPRPAPKPQRPPMWGPRAHNARVRDGSAHVTPAVDMPSVEQATFAAFEVGEDRPTALAARRKRGAGLLVASSRCGRGVRSSLAAPRSSRGRVRRRGRRRLLPVRRLRALRAAPG